MSDRAVVDQGGLVSARFHVPIHRVVAGVQLGSGKPAVEGFVRVVEHAIPTLDPVDAFGDFAPEAVGVFERTPSDFGD